MHDIRSDRSCCSVAKRVGSIAIQTTCLAVLSLLLVIGIS